MEEDGLTPTTGGTWTALTFQEIDRNRVDLNYHSLNHNNYYWGDFQQEKGYTHLCWSIDATSNELGQEKIPSKLYVNGKLVANSWYDREYYQDFSDKEISSIIVGATNVGLWHQYSCLIGDVYYFRLYNRGLSEDEVESNFEKALSYYSNFIENGN